MRSFLAVVQLLQKAQKCAMMMLIFKIHIISLVQLCFFNHFYFIWSNFREKASALWTQKITLIFIVRWLFFMLDISCTVCL